MNDSGRFRILLLTLGTALLFGVVAGRLFQIQVLQHDFYLKRWNEQHNRPPKIERERGTLYDRAGREVAVSIPVRSLFANPREIGDPARVARLLSPLINVPVMELQERLSKRERAFMWLSRKMPDQTADAVEKLEIEGLYFVREYKRFYPQMNLAAQVIGFAGVDEEGLEGLELQFNKDLIGQAVELENERDASGRRIRQKLAVPHFYGKNIVLTLDMAIQAIVEEELGSAVDRYQARSATAIVMDPRTGEILAMATLPSYNPNNYLEAVPSLRRNRAVTDSDEPGSTFKIFTASALLDLGLVSPSDNFYDPGFIKVHGSTIHSHHPLGALTFQQVVEKSSNVGTISAGLRMKQNDFYRYLRAFGFGEKTEIELPGEVEGVLRPVSRWSGLSQAMLSMGHEVGVTPIQMARASAVVANGGLLLRPQIVREIRDASGKRTRTPRQEEVRRVIRLETAQTLNSILEGVVERGTGIQAQVPGFRVAGKTGTAQRAEAGVRGYVDRSYNASFVGWLPAENPALLVLVTFREPDASIGYYGGSVAGPAFGRIGARVMNYLNIYPSKMEAIPAGSASPEGTSPPSIREVLSRTNIKEVAGSVTDTGVVVPTLVGRSMREVYERASRFPLKLKMEGSGVAVQQFPAPGAIVPAGSPLRVVFVQDMTGFVLEGGAVEKPSASKEKPKEKAGGPPVRSEAEARMTEAGTGPSHEETAE